MRDYWRGSVETWECDEMGHMNVRFWVRRAYDGLMLLATDLGLERAFAREASATWLPVSQHIRFLKEAHAGTPLFFRAGVIEITEAHITLYGEIVHSVSGVIGATFQTKLFHVEASTGRIFPWPSRTHSLASALLVAVPPHGKPRSVAFDGPVEAIDVKELSASGFRQVGLATVRPQDVDVFDRLYPEGMMALVSNGVPNLMMAWRDQINAELAAEEDSPRQTGAAVLEYRLDYLAWPRPGDFIALHSGLAKIGEKTLTLKHVLLHPVTGQIWSVCEAVAVTFDLVARKIVSNPPKVRALMEQVIIRPNG
ncbi:thioesterase family protein [Candidatus Phycosocius spiralis]|uniref:Thioesterase n=1 Tax=Candidatus Phycosocius spiralis TaxID=2815099 RepID=A0ABQ4PXF3_9PROT|nr:thioesterase family protein [Candidatus Phycosocius spiralis]GIU67770.1 thioesterase [Candidatus Phycosocius spiralis]